ncbi:hypothetical protein [Legionella sp. km772]|uniref:hypothetical protein n=1 Tax=Legionella sp. km772 TaxID=2498111 RepID=UPI000F8E525B|nr:hypothetical protein [Legionella sp. km772]RUR10534.1 hypothetical protein ELY15_08015 [Legionella sp. km772]
MRLIKQLLSSYWNICLLRESPENSPYSIELLFLGVFLFVSVMSLQWSFSDFNFSNNLLLVIIASFCLVFSFIFYTFILLFLKKLKARSVQTATSLLYVHSIIHILALPLFILDPYLTHVNLKNPIFLLIGVLYLFVTLGLSIWQFIVTAHIYKFALNSTPIQSVLAAFGLVAVNVLTLSFWR